MFRELADLTSRSCVSEMLAGLEIDPLRVLPGFPVVIISIGNYVVIVPACCDIIPYAGLTPIPTIDVNVSVIPVAPNGK